MFDSLTERLSKTVKNLRGQGRLSEDNIKDTLREVRMALLEADVALAVVKDFVAQVKARAIGKEVIESISPGQAFIKIVNDELVTMMGETNDSLNLSVQPPAVILMAGLQGSGKTTSVAKLSRLLKQQKKSVLVTSADVYRPAAIEQLETLAKEVDVEFFPSDVSQDPVDIGYSAIEHARKKHLDVVIVDTAGRLHIDDEMMGEIKRLHKAVNPVETLFVVDSMTGQDAANTAKAFNEALELTGVILTKTDGDARGGAALSIRQITGKPIKFMGVGEKIDALEAFHPDRLASRILGMGDILSLVEDAQQKVDLKKANRLVRKIKKGKNFDLEDFKDQILQMKKMGGMAGLMDKLPGMGAIPQQAKNQVNDKELVKIEAMINSMTPGERQRPELIKGSRKKRISNGSGTQIQDLNRLLKQFKQMHKMMKKVSKGGMKNMMSSLKGRLPPGMGGGMGGGMGRMF
ncbi:MAG: signal recognition particle protein [gamma proteobacterium symbiont of Taylorina sp.]|nr:signal recognition particle protein [gamma proteobacterium symbiont of Taylorina sp.]